jgi:hypothetical protein
MHLPWDISLHDAFSAESGFFVGVHVVATPAGLAGGAQWVKVLRLDVHELAVRDVTQAAAMCAWARQLSLDE